MIESKRTSAVAFQPDELVGHPGDGVGLAAAGRVFDEVPAPHIARRRVGQQLPHEIELMIAREDLLALDLAGLAVRRWMICA